MIQQPSSKTMMLFSGSSNGKLAQAVANKLKTDLITILINLTIIQEKEENTDSPLIRKNINISNNPKCLLLQKKDQKISRNERCEATGKKFKQCCGALQ